MKKAVAIVLLAIAALTVTYAVNHYGTDIDRTQHGSDLIVADGGRSPPRK